MILVDSNIFLDLRAAESVWRPWSEAALRSAFRRGPVGINVVIFSELCVRSRSPNQLEAGLRRAGIRFLELPFAAGAEAARAFRGFLERGGTRSEAPLPDFFIGAHALVSEVPLLTRDRRIPKHFPTIEVIAPADDEA